MNDDDLITLTAPGDGTSPAFPTSRLPGESGVAYAAFKQWLAMDTGSRSIVGVAGELGKSTTLIGRWAGRWHWKARLLTHEDEQAAIQREAEIEAALKYAKVREERRAEVEELQYLAGRELVQKAREIVALVGPSRPGDAARLAAVGVQLLRLATGLPPNKIEVTGKDDSPLVPLAAGVPVVNLIIEGGSVIVDPLPPEGEVEEESDGV